MAKRKVPETGRCAMQDVVAAKWLRRTAVKIDPLNCARLVPRARTALDANGCHRRVVLSS